MSSVPWLSTITWSLTARIAFITCSTTMIVIPPALSVLIKARLGSISGRARAGHDLVEHQQPGRSARALANSSRRASATESHPGLVARAGQPDPPGTSSAARRAGAIRPVPSGP